MHAGGSSGPPSLHPSTTPKPTASVTITLSDTAGRHKPLGHHPTPHLPTSTSRPAGACASKKLDQTTPKPPPPKPGKHGTPCASLLQVDGLVCLLATVTVWLCHHFYPRTTNQAIRAIIHQCNLLRHWPEEDHGQGHQGNKTNQGNQGHKGHGTVLARAPSYPTAAVSPALVKSQRARALQDLQAVMASLDRSRVPPKLWHSLAGLYRAAKLHIGGHQCYGEQRQALESLLSKAGIAGTIVEARLICEMAFGRGDGMPARIHARLGSGTSLAVLLTAAWKRVCALGQRYTEDAVWLWLGDDIELQASRSVQLQEDLAAVHCHVLPILLSSGAGLPSLRKRAARLGLWQPGRDQHGAAPSSHTAQLCGVTTQVAAPDVHDVAQFPMLNAWR